MLKHVQLSPYRTRAADSVSLSSRSKDSMRTHLQASMRSHQDSLEKRDHLDTVSLSSTTSLSPEPLPSLLSSRSSSYCSLSDAAILQQSPAGFLCGLTELSTCSPVQEPKYCIKHLTTWRGNVLCSEDVRTRRQMIPPQKFKLVQLSEHDSPAHRNKTTIKVYAKCLRSDIEYKTLGITYQTTCREVVASLLNKYRMRHRDPNLFYLTMEVTVRKANLRTVLALDEEARPAALQSCHPRGDSKFALQMKRGGLVKIYDSVLMPGSHYKSLLIAERTTVDELIQILLNCYNSHERVEQFSLYEVCEDQEYQRKLHPDDCPLQVQHTWLKDLNFHFLIKRNADYRRSKNSWSAQEPSSVPSSSRHEPQSSSFSPSSLSSSSSSSSEESSSRYSCYSEYDNYFYI